MLVLQCMKKIARTTEVVSVSLPKNIFKKLEQTRKRSGQSRSAFIVSLVDRAGEDERWLRLYQKGLETAKRFKITSEEDIDRILHEK